MSDPLSSNSMLDSIEQGRVRRLENEIERLQRELAAWKAAAMEREAICLKIEEYAQKLRAADETSADLCKLCGRPKDQFWSACDHPEML